MIEQRLEWQGKHGDDYVERNPKSIKEMDAVYMKELGITSTELIKRFYGHINKNSNILEVGCGVGIQLAILKKLGFTNLYGIDTSQKSVDVSRTLEETKGINIIQGDAQKIPFKDGYFNLVFTTRMLIHIDSDDHINMVMAEIVRCSRGYVGGMEYYNPTDIEVSYHGKDKILWKGNYKYDYTMNFNLAVIEAEKYTNIGYPEQSGLIDEMFLLEKKNDI